MVACRRTGVKGVSWGGLRPSLRAPEGKLGSGFGRGDELLEVACGITQGNAGWGFYPDFPTPEGKPMSHLTYAPERGD